MPDSPKQSLTSPSPAAFSSSSTPSSSSSNLRLSQISTQIAPMAATAFDASVVPQAPEDALFGLMAAYRRDTDSNKVDLGIGAYRDNNAKPWVLPVVKKVRASAGAPDSHLLTILTGRRDPAQGPRPQPRVSAHCRLARLYNSFPEARPWW